MTPSVSELRGQLARMLESPLFASRPRSAELLTYFVEHSIRNGFAPINQQEIAIHGLGFGQDFSPARSAEVRVKVARLRNALDNYFRGPGRGLSRNMGHRWRVFGALPFQFIAFCSKHRPHDTA